MIQTKCWELSFCVSVLFAVQTSANYIRPPGTCLDKVFAIPGHTMCLDVQHEHPIKNPERNIIQMKHNEIRGKVTPKAANMIQMEYLGSMEKSAQIWAEQCTLTHDKMHLRFMPGRYSEGQNMLISPTDLTWDQVIDTWASESTSFTYGQTNDVKLVGNYTQIVWATSFAVGCGMSKCGSLYFYVCNYAPSGNLNDISHPYVESVSGQSSDDCQGHVSNLTATLCDCQGLVCLNGGTLNLKTCTCDCLVAEPNRYLQLYCELQCNQTGDQTGCGAGNYTKSSCETSPDTAYRCPWLCNVCPYAGVNYTEGQVSMPWTTTVPTTSTKRSKTTTTMRSMTTTTSKTSTTSRSASTMIVTQSGTNRQTQGGGNHGNRMTSYVAHQLLSFLVVVLIASSI